MRRVRTARSSFGPAAPQGGILTPPMDHAPSTPLPYASGPARPRRPRLPLVAFLWSLFAPVTSGGLLYLLGEGGFDLDDLLPRDATIAVFAFAATGVPLAGAVMGAAALPRAATTASRALAAAAVVLGLLFAAAAAVLVYLAARA